jgi:hypothetical protein
MLWSWTPKKYLPIPLGLGVISLVSASQPRIEVRILIYRKRPIACMIVCPRTFGLLDCSATNELKFDFNRIWKTVKYFSISPVYKTGFKYLKYMVDDWRSGLLIRCSTVNRIRVPIYTNFPLYIVFQIVNGVVVRMHRVSYAPLTKTA